MIDLATTTRRYLHVDEFAVFGQVSRRMVYYWIKQGKLPAVRVHGSLHVPVEVARHFLHTARSHHVLHDSVQR